MVPGAAWRSSSDAEPELFTFIEGYYNARRLHSRNDYRSPNETKPTGACGRWRHNLGVHRIGQAHLLLRRIELERQRHPCAG